MSAPGQQVTGCCGCSATTRRVLITGGSGYLGFRLATELSRQSIEVVLLDISQPAQPLPSGVHFFPGSVADVAAVDAAFNTLPGGALDAVFHVASYGMSGRELRDRAKITSVNVGGTRNVISACLRYGVPRLVYVSTCNVIFVGKPISGGDETAPYPPSTAYKDAYSHTKAQAERLVIESNGLLMFTDHQRLTNHLPFHQERGTAAVMEFDRTQTQQARECDGPSIRPSGDVALRSGPSGLQLHHQDHNQHHHDHKQADADPDASPDQDKSADADADMNAERLYTCCIRSTGIWGPGETRHQPRVIRMVRQGLFHATFGDPSSRSDWIHVDNLVQILILAERGLRLPLAEVRDKGDGNRRRSPIAAGQVYYASDGEPINNFLHFKPIIVGLGYHYPSRDVPFALVYSIAWLIEYVWPLLSHLVADPPLTRMEVDKCCIEHWFDISKARGELGYNPAVYDREEVVRHMAAAGWAATDVRKAPRLLGIDALKLFVVVVVVVAAVVAAKYSAYGSSVFRH